MQNTNEGAIPIILGIEYMKDFWPDYVAAMSKHSIPEGVIPWMVGDIADAEEVINHPDFDVQAVVVQGMPRERFRDILSGDIANAYVLAEYLIARGFRGPIIVVSVTPSSSRRESFHRLMPGQIEVMEKFTFFREGCDRLSDPFYERPSAYSLIETARQSFIDKGDLDWAEGPDRLLSHLDRLNRAIGDCTIAVDAALRQMGIAYCSPCMCESHDTETAGQLWRHEHHGLFNLAVWEALFEHTVLVNELRARFKSDLEGERTHKAMQSPRARVRTAARLLQFFSLEEFGGNIFASRNAWFASWE